MSKNATMVRAKRATGANAIIHWDKPKTHKTEFDFRYISFGAEVCDENGDCIGDIYGVPDSQIFFYGSESEKDDYKEGVHDWTLVMWETTK